MTRLYVHEWAAGDGVDESQAGAKGQDRDKGPGGGQRVALLIHGITGDSGAAWWRFGPELAARGYHVYAPHLRGHGHSPRGAPYTLEAWADDVVESVPAEPDLALGHSLGGLVLAAAVDRLRPGRAVYEDPAWFMPSSGRTEMARAFRAQKEWALADVQAAYPRWESAAHDGKLAALGRWDLATADFVDGFDGIEPKPPAIPSLLMLADPSTLVVPRKADELRRAGFEVRVVPGAGHVIHNDDFAGFLSALDGWL
jgi:pimeloyl-ACP methyl ester carboxylesterase